MAEVRVLLVNHHPIIRASLRQILERDPRVRVIGEAANGGEALLLCQYRNPDVVLLDFQLPVLSGIKTAREIADWQNNTKIVFISVLADEEYVLEAFRAGAQGFVLGAAVQSDLITAIRVVACGGIFLSRPISSEFVDECNRRFVGERSAIHSSHKELFCWLAEGLKKDDIAKRLNTTVASIQMASEEIRHQLHEAGMPETITSLI